MSDFNLLDLLDSENLPLKSRMSKDGLYGPRSEGEVTKRLLSPKLSRQESFDARTLIPKEPLLEGEQYRFHFDMSMCVGCNCCVVACNEQNGNPAEVNWRRVGEIEGGLYPDTKRYHLSMACNHCLDPSCLTGCPTDAYIKLENGIVKHQADECIGCGYCTWNCPYGVPQFNPERNIVTKCDMCHSRLEEGQLPACVAACPETAIQIEKVNIKEWRENHEQADAPFVPHSDMTISTTRITLPQDVPEEVIKGNRHRIEPEKSHTSLIFVTTLTQLAAGGFLALWVSDLLSRFFPAFEPIQKMMAFEAVGMLTVTAIALLSSLFHLGRPLFAYKALRMWKRSWLSREILLFALFSNMGALYSGLLLIEHFHWWNFSIPDSVLVSIGALVCLTGFAGVYASAKIYMVPARPAWNTKRTPLRFFLTGFVLGPLFALVIYSSYLFASPFTAVPQHLTGPIFSFVTITAVSALLQLSVLLARVFSLFDQQSYELYGSAFLLTHRFKKHFIARIFLLVVGCLVLPFFQIQLLNLGHLSQIVFVSLSVTSFLMALCGEWIGRYLFFVTVVPKNIPGSFFSQGGAHH